MKESRYRKGLVRLLSTLLVVVILAVLVSAAEWTARRIGLGTPILYYETNSYRYALRPDQSVVRLRGAGIRTDEYGLRTDHDWDKPHHGRILFIGDSVTYGGAYVDNRDLFSTVACDSLADERLWFVCGNAGINGYGVDNMAYRIRFDPVPAPDVYVVTLLSADTLRGFASLMSYPYHSRPLPGPVPALTEGVLFLLDRLRANIRYGRGDGAFQGGGENSLLVAELSLKRLFAALEERRKQGKRVLLVHSPERSHVENDYGPFDRRVLELLRESGFPVLEMRDALRADKVDLDEIYYDGAHLEVPGHRFYGRAIAGALQIHGIVR